MLYMDTNHFYQLFPNPKPILGMIHLAGDDPVNRALEELSVYDYGGLDGAIIENYHGSMDQVQETLEIAASQFSHTKLVLGVNILPNEFESALRMAAKYAGFVQLDYVAGKYRNTPDFDVQGYMQLRQQMPGIVVLGGVRPKYYQPISDSNVEADLMVGRQLADAVVVTGSGTGHETPREKIIAFRETLGCDYPLIVGAGVTAANVYEQLSIADGAIVGSAFKPGKDTQAPVERRLVHEFMEEVSRLRAAQTL